MSLYHLLTGITLGFCGLTLLVWLLTPFFYPTRLVRRYREQDSPRFSLFPFTTRASLIAGTLVATLFLGVTALYVTKAAATYLGDPRLNIHVALLEDLGYNLDDLHAKQGQLSASDYETEWAKWAHLINQRQPVTTNADDDPLNDPQLFTRFRRVFGSGGQNDKLIAEEPLIDGLFAAITKPPNAVEGFLNGVRFLQSPKNAPEYPISEEARLAGLKSHLYDLLRVDPWSQDAAAPQGRRILKQLGSFTLNSNSGNDTTWSLNKTLAEEEGATVEKILTAHLDRIIALQAPYQRALQMLVGPIQWLTLAMFFAGLIWLRLRFILLNTEQTWSTPKNPTTANPALLGCRLQQVTAIQTTADAAAPQQTQEEVVDSYLNPIQGRLEKTENAFVDYVLMGMPSLGFIGTVLGIGAALGDADKVVRAANAAEQAGAISAVTSLLGIAFDTTLVALICGLPLTALLLSLTSREAQFLHDLRAHFTSTTSAAVAEGENG